MNLPSFDYDFDFSADFGHNTPNSTVSNNPGSPSKTTTHKPGLEKRRALRKAYEKAAVTSRPGGGKRFAALAKSAEAGGAKSGAAVAAVAGRAKYGKKRFQAMAAAGRKRK